MQIVQHNETHYKVTFNYSKMIVGLVKAIPGSAWDKGALCWYVPITKKKNLEKVYEKWLASVALSAPKVIGPIPKMPELGISIPFQRNPYPFQSQGIAYGLQKGNTLICDEPGLGKTTQAIGLTVANEMLYGNGFPALVICPNTPKTNWQREWNIVAGKKALVLNDRIINTWPQFYKAGMADIFIINFESLKKYFVESIDVPENEKLRVKHIKFRENIKLFNTVIIDEIHRCKELKTQTTKITTGITFGKQHVYGLTGTPVVNKTEDLIAQLYIIQRMQDLGGEKYFRARYCDTNDFLDELNYKLWTTCFYSRKKKDVLPELPDKIRQNIICDISTRKEYVEAERNLENYLKKWTTKTDEEIDRSLRGEIMVQMGICKQISARGKIAEASDIIDEIINAGRKIVVFVHHREIADRLHEKYTNALAVAGGMTENDRQANIDAFQNNPKYNIIIVSIKAGGVAITLTAASDVLFVEQPWHAADQDQCIDRCHRIGQKDSVNAYNLLGRNTVDEYINEIIESKREVSDMVVGNKEDYEAELIDRLADSMFRRDKVVETE